MLRGGVRPDVLIRVIRWMRENWVVIVPVVALALIAPLVMVFLPAISDSVAAFIDALWRLFA